MITLLTAAYAVQVVSGAILSDEFVGEHLHERWTTMNQRADYLPRLEGGWLLMQGDTGGGHIGVMTTREHYKDVGDNVVLRAFYSIPSFPTDCSPYQDSTYVQLHLCSAEPDVNVSLTMAPDCRYSPAPPSSIQDGTELVVEYLNGGFESYYMQGGTKVAMQSGFSPFPNRNRRVELKSLFPAVGYELDFRIDYVHLYPHPADTPLVIMDGGEKVEIFLDTDKLYPITYTYNGVDLSGVFPGDVWMVSDKPIHGC